jgi:hypothetical protein
MRRMRRGLKSWRGCSNPFVYSELETRAASVIQAERLTPSFAAAAKLFL